jgi:tRNA (guanine37-N1)-methyltransferase
MKIFILTLFPEMFQGTFDHSIVKRAIDKGLVTIKLINIRDFGIGKHKVVDDKPFGGGTGMIFRVDVVNKAISKIKDKKLKIEDQKIILLTPSGKTFNQKIAENFSRLKHLILVCGHYEGFDKRVEKFVDEKISVGDFITTGGEIPAMLITDAVVRLIKGTLKEGVVNKESFSPYLEYPQYTKPRRFKNLNVPKILLSGNHKKINNWQNTQSLNYTIKSRPDLLEKGVR